MIVDLYAILLIVVTREKKKKKRTKNDVKSILDNTKID